MNETGNSQDNCAVAVQARLRVAAAQWPRKTAECQAIERRFIERDYHALTGCRVSVKP